MTLTYTRWPRRTTIGPVFAVCAAVCVMGNPPAHRISTARAILSILLIAPASLPPSRSPLRPVNARPDVSARDGSCPDDAWIRETGLGENVPLLRQILNDPAYDQPCITAHATVKGFTWSVYVDEVIRKIESLRT